MPTTTSKIEPGDVLAERELRAITGEPVRLPDPEGLTHLQFRRYATCPLCNLHLRSIIQRHDDIAAAGIREVVVFHSPADELLEYQADLPFAVIADPDKLLYQEFGVETAPRALLNPRVWPAGIRGALHARRPLPGTPHGGILGLPADFLIATDATVLARKYGAHAYDQWTVDELLQHAQRHHNRAG
jgi:peroxiredoxin